MKILSEGKAHKAKAWTSTCKYCDSKLRILEGDPMSYVEWKGINGIEYQFRYICPVCNQPNEQRTYHSESMDEIEVEEVILDQEDREEIESWKSFDRHELSETDRCFLHKWG